MVKYKVLKIALLSAFFLAALSGCHKSVELIDDQSNNHENIVIENVETSSELLNSARDKDLEKVNDDDGVIDISSIDNFINFKSLAKKLRYIEYNEANKTEFKRFFEDIFIKNNVLGDGKIYTYDKFINTYLWDELSCRRSYHADINNDGKEDIVVTYKNFTSGNFAGISEVFLKTDNGYKKVSLDSDDDFVSNDISLLKYNSKIYVCMTFGLLDEIFIWDDNSLLKIADEGQFVDNEHTLKDRSLINNQISKEYEIDKKIIDLNSSGISYTNSGYTDKEILITFFKIKKYIDAEDKESMASLVMYPISYKDHKNYIKLYNKEQFIENYDKIVNDRIKKLVSDSEYKSISSSWRGAMIAGGDIVFTNYIIGINQ